MKELRACPHCGGRPFFARVYKLHGPFREQWAVLCTKCIRATKGHIFRRFAVKEWNEDDTWL